MARLGSPGSGSGTVYRLGSVEKPGDNAVLALVDRRRARLAAHRAIDGLDGHLAGNAGA